MTGATAALELRRWSRQKRAVLTTLLVPVAVAVLVVEALGGTPRLTTTWAIVDLDHGPGAAAFVEEVLGDPELAEMVTVRSVGLRQARRQLRQGDVGAVIVLPRNLTESVAADGRPSRPDIEVLRSTREPISSDLATLVVDIFSSRAWATAVSRSAGTSPVPGRPLELVAAPASGGQLDAPTHYGPAIGMFAVLLGLGFAAHAHVADRERGIDSRHAAAPVPLWAVQAGRAAAGLVVGGLGFVTTAATMALVFDRTWGAPLPVGVLIAAVLVAYTGLAALIASVVRTAGQAQIATTGVAFGLAFASGSFTPPGSMSRPPLAELAPSTRALDAFAELAVDGAGLGSIITEVLFLVAVGVAALGVARLTRRSVA